MNNPDMNSMRGTVQYANLQTDINNENTPPGNSDGISEKDRMTEVTSISASPFQSPIRHFDFSFIWMLLWFLLGLICCVLHHLFNLSRNDVRVNDKVSPSLQHQQTVSLIGTAFAFIIKALYAISLEAAYQQAVWRVWRKRPSSVEAIDNAILLQTNVRRFVSWELWKYARRPICIGIIIWGASLGTVFTPGTLRVEPKATVERHTQLVPTLDFFAVANENPHGYKQLAVVGGPSSVSMHYRGPSPELEKLLMLTAYGGFVVPGPGSPCGRNCTYTITFAGPAQKCEHIADYTLDENNPWRGNQSSNTTVEGNHVYDGQYVYITFYDTKLGQRVADQTGAQDLWISWAFRPYPVDGIPDLSTYEFPARPNSGWELHTIRCVDYNATYTVDVLYVEGVEHMNVTLTYLHPTNYTDSSGDRLIKSPVPDADGLYLHRAAKEALIKVLEGSLYMAGGASTRSFMAQSSIINTLLVQPYNIPSGNAAPGLHAVGYIPILDLGSGIEDLSVNLTLTLLGTQNLVYRDPKGAIAEVETSLVSNVYKYEPRRLILSYAVLTGLTALAVATGLAAALRNGFWGETTFATMYVATRNSERNEDANAIASGRRTRDDILKTRLRVEIDGEGKPVFRD